MGGVSIAWEENEKGIAEGTAKFYGQRIVGKFLEKNIVGKSVKKYTNYTVKLYADFNNHAKSGQEPDGETVTLWGCKVIDSAFERGYDGTGIKTGDIIEVIYHGEKKTADGSNTYKNFTVNAFTPAPKFNQTAPVAAPQPDAAPAPAKNDALDQLGYN